MYAFVLPYAGAVGQDFIIQDDNARPHQARVVTEYLGREEIDSIEWSTRSVEHVWDTLQRWTSARLVKLQSGEDLTQALVEQWARIRRLTIRKFCSIKSRAVSDDSGDTTQF